MRAIRMNGVPAPDTQPRAPLGYSVGRWEGNTLVVTTSRIAWPYFDDTGIPLGARPTIVERFAPTSDGTRLNLTMTITDQDTFTQPVELARSWVWRSGETVRPYNCVERKAAAR